MLVINDLRIVLDFLYATLHDMDTMFIDSEYAVTQRHYVIDDGGLKYRYTEWVSEEGDVLDSTVTDMQDHALHAEDEASLLERCADYMEYRAKGMV